MGRKYISKWIAKREADIKPSEVGTSILDGRLEALVKYKNKKWNLNNLIIFLAAQIEELKQNQCVPNTSCLFRGREYIENKYIPGAELAREYCDYVSVPYWFDEE